MRATANGVSIDADLGLLQLLPQRHQLLAACCIIPFLLRLLLLLLLLCSLAAGLHSRLCGSNTLKIAALLDHSVTVLLECS